MVLAIVLYTACAALFYAWMARSAAQVDDGSAEGTHPVRNAELVELFPAEENSKAA